MFVKKDHLVTFCLFLFVQIYCIPRFSYRSPLTVPPPSFLRFWNRSKTLTRLEEEFETSDVFRVIYSNNWNLFSSQFIVKYLLSSFPFWITAKMQYDWRKVVELSNKFEERQPYTLSDRPPVFGSILHVDSFSLIPCHALHLAIFHLVSSLWLITTYFLSKLSHTPTRNRPKTSIFF